MIGVKQEFYSSLRDDYIKKGRDSFLYRYMEQEKMKLLFSGEKKLVFGKRSDAYLQIKRYQQDYMVGKLTETEFVIKLLKMLLKGDKLRLKKESRQMLFDFASEIEGDTFLEGCKRDSDKYSCVIESLSGKKEAVSKWKSVLVTEILEKMSSELLDSALAVDIQTFLYDVGYPVNANGKIHTARKKDRNLDMLTAFCRENQISLHHPNMYPVQGLSDEQIDQYKQLYKALQTSDNLDVVIPVQIDTVTGAGVYIVGKNNVSPKSEVYKKIKGNCCYVCFLIDGLSVEDYNGISSFSWLINDEENTLCNLPDLEEALKWHIYFKAESLGDFQERNGSAPEGCPEELKHFFEESFKEQSELYISEEELAEAKAIFTNTPT